MIEEYAYSLKVICRKGSCSKFVFNVFDINQQTQQIFFHQNRMTIDRVRSFMMNKVYTQCASMLQTAHISPVNKRPPRAYLDPLVYCHVLFTYKISIKMCVDGATYDDNAHIPHTPLPLCSPHSLLNMLALVVVTCCNFRSMKVSFEMPILFNLLSS